MSEHVILVALVVEAPDREAAELHLYAAMRRGMPLGSGPFGASTYLDSWWVAEDDRRDRSDNDSAVFCAYGYQDRARATVVSHGFDTETVERQNDARRD